MKVIAEGADAEWATPGSPPQAGIVLRVTISQEDDVVWLHHRQAVRAAVLSW